MRSDTPVCSARGRSLTPYILVVSKARDDVFAALFFDGLPADLRSRIRILEFGREPLTAALAGAAAVIVMRHGLFSFGHVAAAAGWAGVPRYYFLDDNLMLLSGEPEIYGPYWSAYTDDRVRRALRGFEGVMLASRPLMQYFEEHALHRRLIDYPPIAWPILRTRDRGAGAPFRIAFFGGEHRRALFTSLVYPAAERLAAERDVELVVVGIEPEDLKRSTTEDTEDTEEQSFSRSRLNLRVPRVPRVLRGGESAAALPQLRVVHLPYDIRYGAALEMLAGHRIDVLAHPTPPSRNNPYRNANVLINARSIGAVPVLSRMPPYDALGSPGPAVLCENEIDAWQSALARLAADPQACDDVFRRTSAFCDDHFSGRPNVDVISHLLETHAAPRPLTRAARALIAGPRLGLDRTVVRAKDLARRSALVRTAAGRLRHRTV